MGWIIATGVVLVVVALASVGAVAVAADRRSARRWRQVASERRQAWAYQQADSQVAESIRKWSLSKNVDERGRYDST